MPDIGDSGAGAGGSGPVSHWTKLEACCCCISLEIGTRIIGAVFLIISLGNCRDIRGISELSLIQLTKVKSALFWVVQRSPYYLWVTEADWADSAVKLLLFFEILRQWTTMLLNFALLSLFISHKKLKQPLKYEYCSLFQQLRPYCSGWRLFAPLQIFPQMFFRESTEMLFMTNKFPFPADICYVMIMAFSSTDVWAWISHK